MNQRETPPFLWLLTGITGVLWLLARLLGR
jgi:hypothetical protein